MKTFDEAFEIIRQNTNTEKFTQDIKSGVDLMTNKHWCQVIELMAAETVEIIVKNECSPLVNLCSAFHGVFQLGLLTGIEMEKL